VSTSHWLPALLSISTVVGNLGISSAVRAECFLEADGGVTQNVAGNAFVTRKTSGIREGVQTTFRDIELDASGRFGLRAGCFQPELPFVGYALNFAYFQANVPSRDTRETSFLSAKRGPLEGWSARVWILGGELRLRAPLLRTYQIPDGRLQPFLAVGPALFRQGSDDRIKLGVQGGAGLTWMFMDHLGLTLQYGVTHFSAVAETAKRRAEFALTSHHLLGGLSLRFGN
jgi:hypothetical protein